ncbi:MULTISPECIES: TraR/DksA C4-type zinc finger protein [unclassified Micromonospora]|uniref:TraR/DksA family transcriptional regulator n=1 Tax=unclassified Micromonospora TaxID=2617518 RepID=UPI0010353103|nr:MULTISPECIES: TraR/DksA C4-type zinc finger protein [unclassified Micromonospora]QKW14743.1 TraR/DksA C4-type zinc finger protein [Verrucosispora sp. NA02020]TBL28343.1 TraR/DksA family transcriptional regulator [Verrucosispora sp. SN26_14.1]
MSTNTYDPQWRTELRATLTHEFEAQTARLTELTADTGDPAEALTNGALIAATRQSLEQITGALRRLANGSYGSCEKCGTTIPQERLEILPHARFCVPCQQKHKG